MNIKIRSVVLLIGILSFLGLKSQDYKLVWEDNFDGLTLDSSKWNIEQREGIWNTGSNSEFQHYRKENVTVAADGNGNNCLVLTAKKENYNGYAYTSGKVTTKGKFAFKRGKLEASIKIPDLANGLWPAFWTLGYTPVGWPDCGEIDVLEMGHAKGITDGVQNSFIGSHLFWGPYPSDYGLEKTVTEDLSTGYFKHTVIWTETKISVYFNDDINPYFSMGIGNDIEEFKNFQNYIILNLAVGGSVPGIFNASGITASFPANMYIDWIKVYQLEGSEDYTSNLDLYGDFGVYEDETAVDMRMDLGYDLEALTLGVIAKVGETPFEGPQVLAYNTTNEQAFEINLNSGLTRNLSNYNQGSLQFAIKTNLTNAIQIGVSDTTGAEKFISFSSTDENNFLRDGTWQSAYISLVEIENEIDLSALKNMLIVKGTANANGYISIDKVIYKETVPAKGFYRIFTDNTLITEGFVVDNVNYNMYIWNNTVTFTQFYPAYEGENVHSFKSSGAETWFGFGYHSANALNFEAYANGYLNISMRTTSTKEFYIGIDGEGSNGEIKFISGSDPYGFERDGEWHHLNIPFADITQLGLDLSSINHVFKTGGSSIGDIAFDNIYYSEGLPDIENAMICYANSITVTPNNRTLDVDEELTFKAAVLNQYGNKFDAKVNWSTSGGVIDAAGIFSSSTAGDFIVTATQSNVSATANVKVIPLSDVKNMDENTLQAYINNNLNSLIVTNINNDSYVTVYAVSGKLIFASQTANSETTIDMSNQPAGVYIVKVISTEKVYTNRVVKP